MSDGCSRPVMPDTDTLRGALLPGEDQDQHLLLLTSAGVSSSSPGRGRRVAAAALAALAFVCSLAALVVALVSWSQVQG